MARFSIPKLEYMIQYECQNTIKKKSKIKGIYEGYNKIVDTLEIKETKQRNSTTENSKNFYKGPEMNVWLMFLSKIIS